MSPTDWVATSVGSGGLVAFPVAFVGGVVMGLNPCCLAMFPAAAATCSAGACSTNETTAARKPIVANAALFVLGNALAITTLGVLAAVAGRTLTGLGGWISYAVALVPIVMGVHLLGWLRLPMPKSRGQANMKGKLGAFVAGFLLSLVLGPCGTPAMAAILAYAALEGNVAFAAALMFAYGLGNGLPLLLVGTAAGGVTARLQDVGWRPWVERTAGVGMLCLGFFLLWTTTG